MKPYPQGVELHSVTRALPRLNLVLFIRTKVFQVEPPAGKVGFVDYKATKRRRSAWGAVQFVQRCGQKGCEDFSGIITRIRETIKMWREALASRRGFFL